MEENIYDNFSLAYDSLMNAVNARYPTIKKIQIKIRKENDPKNTYDNFINAMNETIIPYLAKEIRQPHESLSEAAARLKQLHIDYLNKRVLSNIEREHNGNISKVEFITETLAAQGNDPAQSSCYKRNAEGLPGIRKHTFGNISYYHHASPVPYQLTDAKQRIEITQRNFEQLKRIVRDQPVTEIRLLSPLAAPHRWFDFSQKQYNQISETYLALLLNNNDIRMFVYGTNRFRANYDELQIWINTRSLNDLFFKVIPMCDLSFPASHASEIQRLKAARQKLARQLKNADKKTTLDLIKQHHALEREMFNLNIILWENNKKHISANNLIAKDFNQVLKLTDKNDWTKAKHNYQLQATLVRLENSLGQCVATGCNDGKDRDGRLAVTVEAHEIFYQRENHYPDSFNKTDLKKLQDIEADVYRKSTPRLVAEAISIPGANQLEISAKDGNKHLPIKKSYLAHMFKDMHQLHKSAVVQDHLASAVKKEKAVGNWLAATFMGVVFSVFTAFFGAPEIATASTVAVSHSNSAEIRSMSESQKNNGRDEMPGLRNSWSRTTLDLKHSSKNNRKKDDDLINDEQKEEDQDSPDEAQPHNHPLPTANSCSIEHKEAALNQDMNMRHPRQMKAC